MYKRILIVVDQRPASRAALDVGLRLASACNGSVTFFNALPRYPLQISELQYFDAGSQRDFDQAVRKNADELLAAARKAADNALVMSRGIAWSGDDDVAGIVETARRNRCELIVVASEGRNAVMRLLTGSVVPGLITMSTIPVLVCKPRSGHHPGAHSPSESARPRANRKRSGPPTHEAQTQ